jgi:hypothetical protein
MFRDEHRRTVWDKIRQRDIRVFSAQLTGDVVQKAALRAGVAIGTGPLNVVNLTWLAISSALHPTKNFTDILTLAFKLLQDYQSFGSPPPSRSKKSGQKRSKKSAGKRSKKAGPKQRKKSGGKAGRGKPRSKHDPRRGDPTVVSEEAFTKARRLLPLKFWTELILALVMRIEQDHSKQLYWKGLRLLALDGTVINLPRWKALRDHYGVATNGTRAGRTQVRMVMLQFPLARLPYCYALSPLKTNEIPLATSLLGHVRPNDLILMDRGFFSYGMFWAIQHRGAFFAIRLKAGVVLKTLRSLGRQDRLVIWKPRDQRKKWRNLPESMRLRVIPYEIPGFRPSAVVTNVTDPKLISREEWVRLTTDREVGRNLQPGLYHRRWEIETTFKELKVAQNMKGGLRSRTPQGIEYEIAGHVLLYLLVRWLMLEAAEQHGIDPLRISFMEALRELEDIRHALLIARPRWARVLVTKLLERIASHSVPFRPGRSYPRPNDGKTKDKGKGRKQVAAKIAA